MLVNGNIIPVPISHINLRNTNIAKLHDIVERNPNVK